MSEPLTQAQVEKAISQEAKKLRELVEEMAGLATSSAIKEAHYKTEFAKARLSARANGAGTDKVADSIATVETSEAHLEHLLAESSLTTVREAVRACQSRLSAFQSLLSSITRVT